MAAAGALWFFFMRRRVSSSDGRLPEGHAALGRILQNQFDWVAAERAYRRAIELRPEYARAHQYYALMLSWNRRFAEAKVQGERAREIELVETLKQCGDDLTRENVMKQAASLTNLQLGVLLPGIRINTGPTQFAPIRSVQLQRFNGRQWERFGSTIDE